jgi:phosphate transport system substrate-binding protein
MRISCRKYWLPALLVGLLSLFLAMAGCGQENASTTGTESLLKGTITESGSTSVQPLAEKLGEAFTAQNSEVSVVIQGGGSSTGIKAATDGTVDFGASSRELTEAEAANLQEYVICKDGIAIIVSTDNPVDDLSKEQIKAIFSGEITNWQEVGGTDHEIHVVAREEGSGTRGAFEEMIMGKDASILSNAILQSSNGALLQVVKGDSDAIGFLSFGYLESSIKALTINGAEATAENALNGTYPVVRPFLFVTNAEPSGLVKAFFEFCNSAEAQQIIIQEGYISVR